MHQPVFVLSHILLLTTVSHQSSVVKLNCYNLEEGNTRVTWENCAKSQGRLSKKNGASELFLLQKYHTPLSHGSCNQRYNSELLVSQFHNCDNDNKAVENKYKRFNNCVYYSSDVGDSVHCTRSTNLIDATQIDPRATTTPATTTPATTTPGTTTKATTTKATTTHGTTPATTTRATTTKATTTGGTTHATTTKATTTKATTKKTDFASKVFK